MILKYLLFHIWTLILIHPIHSQICNNNDPDSGGTIIPAFSSGGGVATEVADPTTPNSTILKYPETDPQPMAVLYIIILLWLFMGIGLFADVFMGAIEVITQKKKNS